MRDTDIIALYWRRDESAIKETVRKYGGYCYAIAYNILGRKEDSDECVNDTWLKAWDAMPPNRPAKLSCFLGKITRNLSFDKLKSNNAKKRGGGEIKLVIDELDACIPAFDTVEQALSDEEFGRLINRFLRTLPERERNLFLSRYWYSNPIAKIADIFSMKENTVKASLFRSRIKLKCYLEKEDIFYER